MIQLIREKYGRLCLGLKVDYQGQDAQIPVPEEPLRFCEAVGMAFEKPLLVRPGDLKCPGSKRSMGLLPDEEALIENIQQESGIDREVIRKAIREIPRLEKPVENILLGIHEEMEAKIRPDMYILFLEPGQAMELMKTFAFRLRQFPVIRAYTFMSVCGNVFVSTYKNRDFSISLGCPDSRKYAGLADNLLVAGIPNESCLGLFS